MLGFAKSKILSPLHITPEFTETVGATSTITTPEESLEHPLNE